MYGSELETSKVQPIVEDMHIKHLGGSGLKKMSQQRPYWVEVHFKNVIVNHFRLQIKMAILLL